VILVHYKTVAAFVYSFSMFVRGSIRDVMHDSSEHKLYTGFKGYRNTDF